MVSFPPRLPLVLLLLGLACVLPEAAIHLSPYPTLTRNWLIQNFAFWPGLLFGWRANYPFQTELMFLGYGFLHTGLLHLVFNLLTLASLGRPLVAGIGPWRFLLLYVAAQIGGAVGYAFLASQTAPMVGASGALFGLAGALLWVRLQSDWEELSPAMALRDIAWPVTLLVGLNVVMYLGLDGRLAWETHLGGFLAGAVAMAAMRGRATF